MKCTVFVTALFVYVVTIGVDGAKDDHVYLMEVKLPTLEERGEDIEISHINQFLGSSYGVNDIYRFKIIGEPRAIAILKVRNACSWNRLTTTFVQMGEDFYVTSLYEGESLADDLGVNETLIGEGPSGFPDSNLYFIDVTFAPGKTTPTVLHSVTEKILNLRAEDTRLAFYKILGQVPARGAFGHLDSDIGYFIVEKVPIHGDDIPTVNSWEFLGISESVSQGDFIGEPDEAEFVCSHFKKYMRQV